jgi:hypothetical protein
MPYYAVIVGRNLYLHTRYFLCWADPITVIRWNWQSYLTWLRKALLYDLGRPGVNFFIHNELILRIAHKGKQLVSGWSR